MPRKRKLDEDLSIGSSPFMRSTTKDKESISDMDKVSEFPELDNGLFAFIEAKRKEGFTDAISPEELWEEVPNVVARIIKDCTDENTKKKYKQLRLLSKKRKRTILEKLHERMEVLDEYPGIS